MRAVMNEMEKTAFRLESFINNDNCGGSFSSQVSSQVRSHATDSRLTVSHLGG